jgi:hypothetical protein
VASHPTDLDLATTRGKFALITCAAKYPLIDSINHLVFHGAFNPPEIQVESSRSAGSSPSARIDPAARSRSATPAPTNQPHDRSRRDRSDQSPAFATNEIAAFSDCYDENKRRHMTFQKPLNRAACVRIQPVERLVTHQTGLVPDDPADGMAVNFDAVANRRHMFVSLATPQ